MKIILSSKKPDEIYADFKARHNISKNDWEEMKNYIRSPKYGRYFFPILFDVILFLVGLCLVIALIGSMRAGQFPFVFHEVTNFFHRFVNTFEAAMLIVFSLAFMVYPWIYWAKLYNWEDR